MLKVLPLVLVNQLSAPPVPRVMLPLQTFSWRSRSAISSVICSEPISPVSSFIEPIEDHVVSLLSSINGAPLVTAVDQLQPSLDSTDNLFSTPGSFPSHYTPETSPSGGCLPSPSLPGVTNTSSGGCLSTSSMLHLYYLWMPHSLFIIILYLWMQLFYIIIRCLYCSCFFFPANLFFSLLRKTLTHGKYFHNGRIN